MGVCRTGRTWGGGKGGLGQKGDKQQDLPNPNLFPGLIDFRQSLQTFTSCRVDAGPS